MAGERQPALGGQQEAAVGLGRGRALALQGPTGVLAVPWSPTTGVRNSLRCVEARQRGGGLPWPSSTPAATLAAHCMQHTPSPAARASGPFRGRPRGPGALARSARRGRAPGVLGPAGEGRGPRARRASRPTRSRLTSGGGRPGALAARRCPEPAVGTPMPSRGRRCPPSLGRPAPVPCPGRRALRTLAGFLPLRSSSILFSMSAAAARAAWRWT